MKRLFPILLLALAAAACDDSTGSSGGNLSVGDVITVNVNANEGTVNVCDSVINRRARVVATSEHAVVLADLSNPANGFTESEYQQFATEFDRVAWPVDTRNFGTPSDIDNNGRILMLFTSAVNELTPRNADYIVGGFFYARDLFPKKDTNQAGACASSNVREMFYLLAPDPAGTVNGNARSKDYVRSSTFGTLAHEFQHLINASRRLYTNNASDFEDTWLDEGLSHIAEELAFYESSGLGPKQNIAITSQFFPSQTRIDALNYYQVSNLGRLNEYYSDPTGNSPIEADDDDLATRGATWAFLRYSADQKAANEQTMWYNLVNSKTTGIANLTAVLGTDPLPLIQSWGVANYTDDAVTGVAATYTHPSWNFRQVLNNPALGGFGLKVDTLASGVTRRYDMVAAGNAYVRVGVAAGARAEVRTTGTGIGAVGSCTSAGLTAAGQVYQATSAASASLCLDGGTTGAEYTLIPFFASTSGTERAQVSMTATNVVRPTGTPTPVLSPVGPTLARLAADRAADETDAFENQLRRRERLALSTRFSRGGPSRNSSAVQQTSEVRVSVVRTR